jgi:hypothetical protein
MQDANGDMVFGNGLLDFYIDSPEAVAQSVQTRLLLWAGEWFLNIEDGTPYQTNVLGTNKAKSAPIAIRERIFKTNGVTEIVSFDYDINAETRHLSIRATINTIYGQTTVEVNNGF